MLIGNLAKKTGFSADTIRFYEKAGLFMLPKNARRTNNYKEYPDSVLEKLLVLKNLKGFGFTLREIKNMMGLFEADPHSCPDNIPKIKIKVRVIEQKIKELSRIRQKLNAILVCCPRKCKEDCELNAVLNKSN